MPRKLRPPDSASLCVVAKPFVGVKTTGCRGFVAEDEVMFPDGAGSSSGSIVLSNKGVAALMVAGHERCLSVFAAAPLGGCP